MNTTPSLLAPDNYSYKERDSRAPSVESGEVIMFDEPGRVLGRTEPNKPGSGGNAVDCRSHYFRVTKPEYGPYTLRVRHGAGEEKCSLKHNPRIIDALQAMDSDDRYRLLFTIMDVKKDAEIQTRNLCNDNWRKAAAEKRIKTRKVRTGVKVWIAEAAQ